MKLWSPASQSASDMGGGVGPAGPPPPIGLGDIGPNSYCGVPPPPIGVGDAPAGRTFGVLRVFVGAKLPPEPLRVGAKLPPEPRRVLGARSSLVSAIRIP